MHAPPLRVLVVEDEPLIRWAISETLLTAKHDVVLAEDGRAAIHVLEDTSRPVDVVLLDFRLPDSDDLNLLATIRQLAPSAAVVMMTAYGTPEVMREALDLGVSRVISKPFEMQDIEPMLVNAYRSHAA